MHLRAVLQALLVTFLWSTSWVLIKIGLADIPALTFAGLRYTLAAVCLLPFALRPDSRAALRRLDRAGWGRLLALGVLFYAITQGAQFLGLAYLPAVTVSLLLNFTTVLVALMGTAWLRERPTGLQWVGVSVYLAGVAAYFYPVTLPPEALVGITIVLIGVVANAASAVLGRSINRDAVLPPIAVTAVSMSVGGILLLVFGAGGQGVPPLAARHWVIIGWLAVVNTAFAFTLWNHTLKTLAALESSIINGTMLVQIAVLAWIFLGERLSGRQALGMVLCAVGATLVQLRPRRRPPGPSGTSSPV